MAFKTETVSVRDGMFQVEMRCAGRGEPLVWLHHSGGHQDWFPFLDALAENYMVFQPNHPGWECFDGHRASGQYHRLCHLLSRLLRRLNRKALPDRPFAGRDARRRGRLDRDSVKKLVSDAAGLWSDEIGVTTSSRCRARS
jgi:hypothetical protein